MYAGLVLAATILGMVFVIYFITGEGKAQAYTGMLRTALKCAMWLYVVVSQSAIPWPPFVQDLYTKLFSWTTIINFQQVSPECFVSKLPYVYEWSFFVVFPAYVYLIVLVITCSRHAIRNRRYKKQGKKPEPDEPSLALLIHFNFYTVMVTFTTMYLNQMMAPLRIWAQAKGLSSVVDTNLFWIAIGATVFVILSYLLWVFVLPFSRKSSKWRLFTLVYSDGMYQDESLNKLLVLDVDAKSFKMCVSLVTSLTTLLSLIFTSVRGYVALGVVGNILLVVFQFVVQFLDSATAAYQSAVIAFALAAAQLILFLVLAIFKGVQSGRLREGGGCKFDWFAAPTGDTNERYHTANILELCAILVDFTHGMFGYFYAISLIPASAVWASYLCMALAATYFLVTVVVCVWVMWRENRDAIKRRFAAMGAAIRRMCQCKPTTSDEKEELVDEEAPTVDAATSTELLKSSAELLVMTTSMQERKRRSGSASSSIELVDVQPEPIPVRRSVSTAEEENSASRSEMGQAQRTLAEPEKARSLAEPEKVPSLAEPE